MSVYVPKKGSPQVKLFDSICKRKMQPDVQLRRHTPQMDASKRNHPSCRVAHSDNYFCNMSTIRCSDICTVPVIVVLLNGLFRVSRSLCSSTANHHLLKHRRTHQCHQPLTTMSPSRCPFCPQFPASIDQPCG